MSTSRSPLDVPPADVRPTDAPPAADARTTDVPAPDAHTDARPDARLDARPTTVIHRTERDAAGRVWRFVYDPAAQDVLGSADLLRVRCTTGTARAMLVVRPDWIGWPRAQLLAELETALRLTRSHAAPAPSSPAVPERAVARRRLLRNVRGAAWNCVYDPSAPPPENEPDRVRVRCTAGRDRLELIVDAAWHRLGDRQLATLIEQALDARAP